MLGIFKLYIVITGISFSLFAGAQEEPVEHPIITEYRMHLQNISDFTNIEQANAAAEFIKTYPTTDAYLALAQVIENAPDIKHDDVIARRTVIANIVEVFIDLGTNQDIEILNELANWVELELKDRPLFDAIGQVSMALVTVKPANRELKSLEFINNELLAKEGITPNAPTNPKKIEEMKAAHEAALIEIENMYKWMEAEVKGQEEILRSLQNQYLMDLLTRGQRAKPEVFYFMGLPGNGKDTIVKAYVDALWKKKGAYSEHMFPMTIRSRQEAWSYLGSGKGYVDSGDFPPFLKFLVDHSGGKYVLGEQRTHNGTRKIVERNPNWNPKDIPLLTGEPHKGVIFINEAHNIPKEVKDNMLKEAIENGYFKISNPGDTENSVDRIELNMTFIFASNEGISLLEPREKNGTRSGPPLTIQELLANYEMVYRDKSLLSTTVLQTYGERNDVVRPEDPGVSEEFLNRIGKSRMFMLKPLTPDLLAEVAVLMEKKKNQLFETAEGRLGKYSIEISPALTQFLVNYEYIPSENARPIDDRLESFVFQPIRDGILNRKIRSSGGLQKIYVDIHQYQNNAVSAVFRIHDTATGAEYQFTRLIKETLKDIPKQPLPQERIDELMQARQKMLDNAFGVEHVVDRLIEAAIASESESRNSGESSRPATVMAFLGLTSTGKTETAKQYVKARYGSEAKPVVIDFNGVRTQEALEAKVLGGYDHKKNPIKSEFMKAYDRAVDGNICFIFDEAANAPKEILKGLYEILREATATGFTDGKARPMKNVTIILTGNAGERIYMQIPTGLPTEVREGAYREVFRIFLKNPDMQHEILLETFPDAMLARLGDNIYHFGPHSFKSKRQLSQLKLFQGLQTLQPKRSERGWEMAFGSEADLLRMLNIVEVDAYEVQEQGASIDNFVRRSLIGAIKARLLMSGVPSGDQVIIEVPDTIKEEQDNERSMKSRQLKLTSSSGQEVMVDIPLPTRVNSLPVPDNNRALTGYHEAGHEIVSNFYFGDVIEGRFLSVVPGIAKIGKSFIHYAGLRSGEYLGEYLTNKEAVVRQGAVLMGGYMAQELVTLGARNDGGKSNDIMRATTYIQDAILRLGLSEEWGKRAIPQDMGVSEYIMTLSQADKDKLYRITDEWLHESEELARKAILINMDNVFLELGREVTSRGILQFKDMKEIYDRTGMITERSGAEYEKSMAEVDAILEWIDSRYAKTQMQFDRNFTEGNFNYDKVPEIVRFLDKQSRGIIGRFNFMAKDAWDSLTSLQKAVAASHLGGKIKYSSRDAKLASPELLPEKVADVDKILMTAREEATKPVTNPDRFKVIDLNTERPVGVKSCKHIFGM